MAEFLVDTQLPPLLGRYLKNKGHEAMHSTYFPNGHLFQDAQILKLATLENLIVATKDNDFFDNFILNGAPPRILLLQLGNISNKDLYKSFDINFEKIIAEFEGIAQLVILSNLKIVTY